MRNMYKKIKYGFSLAETLLTMVILGIILAFILPSITSTKPSESKLLYKKTFFTISEAVMAVVNNPELYEISEYDVLFHPVIVENSTDENSSSENFCQYLANYLNTVGEIKCDSYPGSLKLANGVAISGIPKEYKKNCTLSTGT